MMHCQVIKIVSMHGKWTIQGLGSSSFKLLFIDRILSTLRIHIQLRKCEDESYVL
jgi:hypothetical protein